MLGVLIKVVVALAVVLVVGHAVLAVVVLRTRARARRDDSLFFQECVSQGMTRTRRIFALLPGPPRCRICYLPFGGIGVLFPANRSRQNPNFCRVCFERLPAGGQELELGVLFADVRGFTTMAERTRPEELARISGRFFRDATEVLTRHNAIIDSFLGDGILALFLPPIPTLGGGTCDVMLSAAQDLVTALSRPSGDLPPLQVGVAVNYGEAFVGNMGAHGVKELCAVGDVVTTAARLQQRAAAGEIVVADAAWQRLSAPDPAVERQTFALRGKNTRVGAYRIATRARLIAVVPPQASRTEMSPPKQET